MVFVIYLTRIAYLNIYRFCIENRSTSLSYSALSKRIPKWKNNEQIKDDKEVGHLRPVAAANIFRLDFVHFGLKLIRFCVPFFANFASDKPPSRDDDEQVNSTFGWRST